jgi:hypothetical protein
MNLAGYAFSLARRQQLSSEEAVALWMEPAMQRSSGKLIDQEAWIARNAAAMAVFHGQVEVERETAGWTMRVSLGDELPPLEAWEAVDYWVAWMTEQARVVATPRGLLVSSRLDGATLTIRFEPGDACAYADSFSAM